MKNYYYKNDRHGNPLLCKLTYMTVSELKDRLGGVTKNVHAVVRDADDPNILRCARTGKVVGKL